MKRNLRLLAGLMETIPCYLRRFLDHFRGPDEETVEKILKEEFGIKESDESYRKLKTSLANLMGRRTREKDFSEFFTELSSQLSKKVVKILSEKDKEIEGLKEGITRSREQLTIEVVMEALSPEILTIIDRPTYEILKLLYREEKRYESLKRILKLRNDELIWRMNYLKDLGFVKLRYSYNSEFYSLSDAGKTIFNKRRAEFERLINLLMDDKVHQLSLKAVGGNEIMAKKLENWLRSSKGRGHMGVIEKLSKEYGNPKKVSQAFFGVREMGATHGKHIGIKIFDHQASGELLLLELEKLHLYNQKIVNHSAASELSTYQVSEMMLTKKARKKNGETVRIYCRGWNVQRC